MHYAGRRLCDMDAIGEIAQRHALLVIEDAAQGLCSRPTGADRSAASVTLAALSFHETKNVTCGEGGAR